MKDSLKVLVKGVAITLATLSVHACAEAPAKAVNKETKSAKSSAAWKPLFDGKTFSGWQSRDGKPINDKWKIEDGVLMLTASGGGDILTQKMYENFELSLEWKISKQGNSGIFYRIAPGKDTVWLSGLEYQILDNDDYPGLNKESHTAGSLFDVYAPMVDADKPALEFNQSRIIVKNDHVEHWLNGKKVVEFDIWSDEWKKRIDASKFVKADKFAKSAKGYIGLQDHGDKVWFKNIKIREL